MTDNVRQKKDRLEARELANKKGLFNVSSLRLSTETKHGMEGNWREKRIYSVFLRSSLAYEYAELCMFSAELYALFYGCVLIHILTYLDMFIYT